MADDNDFTELVDQTRHAQANLRTNIGQLQQLTVRGKEFQKVRKFYQAAPDWSSEEGKKFFNMMEDIKNACDRFGDVVVAAREYVRCAKDFAKDTVVFTTEAQEDLEPADQEDLLVEWTDSINKMKESNDKVDSLTNNFKIVLKRLRAAQMEAAAGEVHGRESAATAKKHAVVSGGGAVTGAVAAGATVVTIGTGGAAAVAVPLIGAGSYVCGWASFKFLVDSGKHKEWEEQFAFVFGQLDEVYATLDSLKDVCTKRLTDLSHTSNKLLNKYRTMTNRDTFPKSDYFKRKCKRLRDESANLETDCIEYSRKDSEIRGMIAAGNMEALSITD